MIITKNAQLLKADQRGAEISETREAFYTFSFGNYAAAHRQPFGSLRFLNDESLAPQQSVTYRHDERTHVLLLPVVGEAGCTAAPGGLVGTEQIACFSAAGGMSYTVSNPYRQHWINFLHLGFSVPQPEPEFRVNDFALDKGNSLISLGKLHASLPLFGRIGFYESHATETYRPHAASNGVFVYVVNGAFEVEGRLMEHRDGLALPVSGLLEFEALSENSILLLLEIPGVKK